MQDTLIEIFKLILKLLELLLGPDWWTRVFA